MTTFMMQMCLGDVINGFVQQKHTNVDVPLHFGACHNDVVELNILLNFSVY